MPQELTEDKSSPPPPGWRKDIEPHHINFSPKPPMAPRPPQPQPAA